MMRKQGELSEADGKQLTEWVARGGRYAERAQVVLMSREGQPAEDVARALGLTVPTVYKWRKRFRQEGCAGLRDRARPGQPRRLTAAQRDEIARVTCNELPESGSRWTIRSLSKLCSVTQHQVRAVWREHDLARHVASANLLGTMLEGGPQHGLAGLFIGPPLSVAVLSLDVPDPSRSSVALLPAFESPRGTVRAAMKRCAQELEEPDLTVVMAELFSFMAEVRDALPVEPLWLAFSSKRALSVPQLVPTLTSRSGITVGAWNRADGWVESVEAWLAQAMRAGESSVQARVASDVVRRLALGDAPIFSWVRARAGSFDVRRLPQAASTTVRSGVTDSSRAL
jgi:transposase